MTTTTERSKATHNRPIEPRTGRRRGVAVSEAPEGAAHPLSNREVRTILNHALHARGIPAKACSRCFVIKGFSAFTAFSSSSDGRRSFCRQCAALRHQQLMQDEAFAEARRLEALAYYHANAPARRELASRVRKRRRRENIVKHANRVQDPNVLKRCAGKCQRTLPETEFRLDRGQPDGLRLKCRDCANRIARRDCEAAYGMPEGQTCYLCSDVISEHAQGHTDHLVPSSQGGSDAVENLWWAHEFCNVKRGNRALTDEEWQRVRGLQLAARSRRNGSISKGSSS